MVVNRQKLATTMVALITVAALGCGGSDPTMPDPGVIIPDPGQNPPDPPDPIQTASRGLVANPGGHVFVDGQNTGVVAQANEPVLVQAPVGTHTIDIVVDPSRPDISRTVRIPNVEFAEPLMGAPVHQIGYRNYAGQWNTGEVWEMNWNFPDSRCPGTNVVITRVTFGLLCVYPDDTLSFCAGPDDNGDGVPDRPSDPNCTEMVWGRTVADPNGIMGEEIHLTAKGLTTGVVDMIRWARLVPPWR